jgi:peptidoglycan LD-endopeptidase LytH
MIKILVIVISIAVFFAGGLYFFYKDDFKDAGIKIINLYEMAKIAKEPRDAVLPVPVERVVLSKIVDTWGGERSGGRKHEGVDIFAPMGTPIYSATEGFFLRKGEGRLGGNYVYILGKGGVTYYYAHLQSFNDSLKFGDRVGTSTIIGYVGNTGNASGTPPHLHLGIYSKKGAENPFPLLVERQ